MNNITSLNDNMNNNNNNIFKFLLQLISYLSIVIGIFLYTISIWTLTFYLIHQWLILPYFNSNLNLNIIHFSIFSFLLYTLRTNQISLIADMDKINHQNTLLNPLLIIILTFLIKSILLPIISYFI